MPLIKAHVYLKEKKGIGCHPSHLEGAATFMISKRSSPLRWEGWPTLPVRGGMAPHLQGIVPLKGGGTAEPYVGRVLPLVDLRGATPLPNVRGGSHHNSFIYFLKFLFDVDMSFINNVAFLIDVTLMHIV
jgi:hypothetical protein